MMHRILYTGDRGFLAGYIIQELLNRGHVVVGIDNGSKEHNESFRSFDMNPNYFHYDCDATKVNEMTLIMRAHDVNQVVATAALIGGIGYFHKIPFDILAKNERIMAATYEAAVQEKVEKVNVMSSSMVYENATEFPCEEGHEMQIPPPSSAYGFQKLACEYFARAAWDQFRMPYTILRPFNCVGKGEALRKNEPGFAHVIPDLITKMRNAKDGKVEIFGSGDQERCYTHGTDIARAAADIIDHGYNDDFNIVNDDPVSVRSLAYMIWEALGNNLGDLELIPTKRFQYDVQRRYASGKKLRTRFSWEPQVSLEDAIKEMVEWVK